MAENTPLEDLMLALDGHLKRLATAMGWDDAKSFRMPKDPSGKIRLSYLAHQGSFLVHVDDARAYLEWIADGGQGTIMKWAKLHGRRLK